MLGGADGDGCGGAAFSESPAPDMSGDWAVAYDDSFTVAIELGGAVYTEEIGTAGGTIAIEHEGQPLSFDLDCTRPEVVCPSEVWATEVAIRQDDAMYPHRIWLQVPEQTCDGALVDPDPAECGADTLNPDCEQVCDGEITTTTKEAFGTIDEPGESFTLLLGAGIATNGLNCVLVGGSVARGPLTTSGTAEDGDWVVEEVRGGTIDTTYAGGCLWAGDPDMDAELEALVLGAKVSISTGYAATRR
jgi:hypothetical protein